MASKSLAVEERRDSARSMKTKLPGVGDDVRAKAKQISKGYTAAIAGMGGALTRTVALEGSLFLERGRSLFLCENLTELDCL